jgi:lathosterol oxidase
MFAPSSQYNCFMNHDWELALTTHSFEFYGLAFLAIILLRYFLVAGGTYWFFYSPFSKAFADPQLSRQPPSWRIIRYPTPWTSFAFDPLEAIGQSLLLVGIVWFMPLHFITLIAVLTTMTIWAVLTHLGLDRLPALFPHHWLGQWVIGPAHHSIHHHKYTVHFGLYFTFWDRLLGTQDADYEQAMSDRWQGSVDAP